MNSKTENPMNPSLEKLTEQIQNLEQRVSLLESSRLTNYTGPEDGQSGFPSLNFKNNIHFESGFGEYGLAWLGNIVLFFAISFLVQYIQINISKIISLSFGYLSVIAIFFLAKNLKNSHPYIAKVFNLNAYLLIYFVTLKLYFFTTSPLITNKVLALICLYITIGILLFMSIRKEYKLWSGITFLLIGFTGLISESAATLLTSASFIAVLSIYLVYRYKWINLLFWGIFLSYFISYLWMLGNPVVGNDIMIIKDHQYSYYYFFVIAAVFSFIALIPNKEENYSQFSIVGSLIFNGMGFTTAIVLITLTFFKDNYVGLMAALSIYCLLYSLILQLKSAWKITAALFALYGFVSMSVSFYGIYDFPQAYFLLAIQSFLVVSIAIWFRSKFIVIMNSILFIILLIFYLSTDGYANGVNISFSLVAIGTARIINWKRERLTIKTEYIRNLYLFAAFGMILFTLDYALPNQFITLSWTGITLIYFVLSFSLKNIKYRYMALGSMIAATLHLFIVDLAKIELVYRVIALLFLALISIGLSIYYTKSLKTKKEQN